MWEGATPFIPVIWAGLDGKYARPSLQRQITFLRRCDECIGSLEVGLLAPVGKTVINYYDDARNQVSTFWLLERVWVPELIPSLTLSQMHSALYGGNGLEANIRRSSYVPDFGGEPPTPLSALEDHARRLNGELQTVDRWRMSTKSQQAAFLARMISEVISSHVFADGNGRVARVLAQYCVRRWGLDYIAIPKVRNAPRWRRSLHAAMAGNPADLLRYLHVLLDGNPFTVLEQSDG